jgi:hypothetical protein
MHLDSLSLARACKEKAEARTANPEASLYRKCSAEFMCLAHSWQTPTRKTKIKGK